MQASAYILVKRGWDHFTTNAVADRAGVNIASLYQYFPSKEAIVLELQRRHIARTRQMLADAARGLQAQRTLRGMIEVMVRASVDEHRVAPALHRAFTEELPRSARLSSFDPNEGEVDWRAVFARHLAKVPDASMAMFITRTAVHAVIHDAAAQRPELLELPLFVDELVTLVERFLRRR